MTFKDQLKEFAKEELTRAGFMNSEFGNSCLDFLDKCSDITDNDTNGMKKLCELLPKLIDRYPISAITKDDFQDETHIEGKQVIVIRRCTRYPYIYEQDGKYYNDRAIAFQKLDSNKNDKMYLYQTVHNSKQEIELPYFLNEEIKIID